MKTVLPWIIAVGSVAFALGTLHRGNTLAPAPAASLPTAQLAPAPAGLDTGEVVYTFKDDAQIQAFTTLWQQRQATAACAALMTLSKPSMGAPLASCGVTQMKPEM